MGTMANRYARLFAMAKVLGMDKEQLSDGAAAYTGQASLRSLSTAQLAEYERILQSAIDTQKHYRRLAMRKALPFGQIDGSQYNFLLDLIADTFEKPQQFEAWLKRYFNSSESEVDESQASQIIVALKDMRSRGYKV